MTQSCGRCWQDKPIEAFSPRYRGTPGAWCRACFKASARGEPAPPHPDRVCAHCGETFTPKQQRSRVCSRRCKDLEALANGSDRERHLRRKYGISQADYVRMLADQGGHCALCPARPGELDAGRYREFLHVDHDHDTGRVRGLLCPDCNLLIGRRGLDWFRMAVAYLDQ